MSHFFREELCFHQHSVNSDCPPFFSQAVIGTSGPGERRTALLFDKHGFWQPKAMLTGDNVQILVWGITLRSPLWFRVLTADVDCISTLNHIDKLPDRQRQEHVSPSQTLLQDRDSLQPSMSLLGKLCNDRCLCAQAAAIFPFGLTNHVVHF